MNDPHPTAEEIEKNETVDDLVRIVRGKDLPPEIRVSCLMLAAVKVLAQDVLPLNPNRRGRLIKIMLEEFGRLMRKYLPLTKD